MAEADRIQQVSHNTLSRATKFLFDNCRIGTQRSHYTKYPRYVPLCTQQIFDALVQLYVTYFRTIWQHVHRFMKDYPVVDPNTPPVQYAARVYVSMWFVDLYLLNREAVKKVSIIAFNELYDYSDEMTYISKEYDQYLTLLSSSIRPTHIKFALEDILYIPYLSENINLKDDNPFGINNFNADEACFYGLMNIVKDRKLMKLTELTRHTLGRPCWLFDWHTDNKVCAWFHLEGNFNKDDITLAYILGVACTPKLAPCDVDDWQLFSGSTVPAVIDPAAYNRFTPRRFYGGYEVRTIEVDTNFNLSDFMPFGNKHVAATTSKRKKPSSETISSKQPRTTEPSQTSAVAEVEEIEVDIIVPRFQIVDWTYYYIVVLNSDHETRLDAFILLGKAEPYFHHA